MTIDFLNGSFKPAMRRIIEEVHADQGLSAQFYWPLDLLGAEMATAQAVGIMEGDELLAFVLFRSLPQAWDISLVVSRPKFRRQGYVKKLLEFLKAAKGHDLELWLEVHEENLAAQKLYEKLGFSEVRRRPRYYKDGATAVVYSCS